MVFFTDIVAPLRLDARMGQGYDDFALRTVNPVLEWRGGTVRVFTAFLAAAVWLPLLELSARADPISELRSLSVFKDADLGKLANGDVLASKGPPMGYSRG
jgi:hypothetical protein